MRTAESQVYHISGGNYKSLDELEPAAAPRGTESRSGSSDALRSAVPAFAQTSREPGPCYFAATFTHAARRRSSHSGGPSESPASRGTRRERRTKRPGDAAATVYQDF